MDYTIREGNYEKLGVQKKDDAVIFTFEGEKEENCSILFYGKKAEPVCKILVLDRKRYFCIHKDCAGKQGTQGFPADHEPSETLYQPGIARRGDRGI